MRAKWFAKELGFQADSCCHDLYSPRFAVHARAKWSRRTCQTRFDPVDLGGTLFAKARREGSPCPFRCKAKQRILLSRWPATAVIQCWLARDKRMSRIWMVLSHTHTTEQLAGAGCSRLSASASQVVVTGSEDHGVIVSASHGFTAPMDPVGASGR